MWLTSRSRLALRQVNPILNKTVKTSASPCNLTSPDTGNENPNQKESIQSQSQTPPKLIEEQRHSQSTGVSQSELQKRREEQFTPYRYIYPEFLPDPRGDWRNRIREKLERIDMLKRRSKIDIPEFYVGSIMSVTVSDEYAPGKSNTFVGICTERGGCGLRAWFNLRNCVDGQGVEILYEMYNPTIQTITVLRLEKRLDENLRYLRDAPLEFSTFPFDMPKEIRRPEDPVPINDMKVPLKPKPWSTKWHLWDLRGVEDLTPHLKHWEIKHYETWKRQNNIAAEKYDLMKIYRSTIPSDEQAEIFGEVHQQLANLTQTLRSQKKKRVFARPQKQA